MTVLKKSWAAVLVGAALALSACGGGADAADATDTADKATTTNTIGIAMPTTSSTRWLSDGKSMVDLFQQAGFITDLEYGEDDIDNQVAQIQKMINDKVSVLVVAAIDGHELAGVLQQAEAAGIHVIAYDRLITATSDVDYYASFDNAKVGQLQAQYIVDRLNPAGASAPQSIELFAGSPDDNNAYLFRQGALSVLQPYLDSGKLVVRSGQTSMDQIATQRWDASTAAARMESLLNANYTSTRLAAVLSPYDGMSRSIITTLQAHGYGSAGLPLPVVTGQDAELDSVKSILAGQQAETVFKDTRALAKVAVEMSEAILKGAKPVVTDTTTYNNGVKVVPANLLEPVSVDAGNARQVLVDSGYYTADQLPG
ncbi:MAG: multiple monosaccharide ABC transporter substrate-binding protein [Janthinobacterium lividum]